MAGAVAAYRVGVERRLREAERDRAAAEARAAEQRRRQRLRLALAGAVALLFAVAGVAAWWAERREGRHRAEALVRQAGDVREAESLLIRAEEALRGEDSERAELALAAAEARADDAGADHLRYRLARRRADLRLLLDLDDVHDRRWTAEAGHFRNDRALAALPAAFERFGVVPGRTPPDAAARLINGSLVRERALAGLELWLRWDHSRPTGPALVGLLHVADPDPYRDAVRRAIGENDRDGFAALAARPEATEQPVWFVAVFASHPWFPSGRAGEVLAAAARPRPKDLYVLMALGEAETRDPARRVGWYRAALAVRPGNAGVWSNLGASLFAAGDRTSAIDHLRESVRLDGLLPAERQNPVVHHNLGLVLAQQADADGAIPHLQCAIRLDPGFAAAYRTLGTALALKHDLDGAGRSLRTAIRLDPCDKQAHYALGLILSQQNDADGAIGEFRRAVELDKDFALPYVPLGAALSQKGRVTEAAEAFREAARLDQKNPAAHFRLAEAWRTTKQWGEAARSYAEVVRLDPKFGPAYYPLGVSLALTGDLEGATRHLAEAARLDPKNAAIHDTLGVVHAQRGQRDAAVACFREAVRVNPRYAQAHGHLGGVLHAKGDLDGAIAC